MDQKDTAMDFDPCALDDEDEILLASLLEESTGEGVCSRSISREDLSLLDLSNDRKPPSCVAENDLSTENSNHIRMQPPHEQEINADFATVACPLQREPGDQSCNPISTTGKGLSMPPPDSERNQRFALTQHLRSQRPVNEILPNNSLKACEFVEQLCQLHQRHEANSPALMGLVAPIDLDDLVFVSERFFHTLDLFRAQGKPSHVDLGYHYTSPDNLHRIRTDGLLTKRGRESMDSSYADGIYTAKNPFAFHGRHGDVGLIVGCLNGCSGSGYSHGGASFDSVAMNRGQRNEFKVLKTCGQCLPMFRFKASLVQPDLREHKGNLSLFHLHEDLRSLMEKFAYGTPQAYHRQPNRRQEASPLPRISIPVMEQTHSRMRPHMITPPSRGDQYNSARAVKRHESVAIHERHRPLSRPHPLAIPFDPREVQSTKKVYVASKKTNEEAELIATLQPKRAPEADIPSDSSSTKKLCTHTEDTAFACSPTFSCDEEDEDCNGVFHNVREGKFSILSQECAICLDILMKKANGKLVQVNRCGHYFHKNCMKTLLEKSNTCPSCQLPFSPEVTQIQELEH